MAVRSTQNSEDSGQRRRSAPPKGGTPIVPIVAVLLLIGAAFYVATAVRKSQAKEAEPVVETSNEPKPFSSVPDEAPPDLSARGHRTGVRASEDLFQNPDWVRAKGIAEQGHELATLSKAAEKAGHVSEYQKKAGEAHDKFDEAVTMTAIWEEEIVEKHGDGDPIVKQIVKIRSRWFSQMRKLRAQSK